MSAAIRFSFQIGEGQYRQNLITSTVRHKIHSLQVSYINFFILVFQVCAENTRRQTHGQTPV